MAASLFWAKYAPLKNKIQRPGSFATLAAMRRAWSRVRLAPLGSQTWFSFFNGRYGSAAALPTTAPYFFETETAGLMFVRHRWPQSFRWWLFVGLRVRMQPQTMNAITIVQKIQSCICCIVVFSVA
jgi:hypothetical protein